MIFTYEYYQLYFSHILSSPASFSIVTFPGCMTKEWNVFEVTSCTQTSALRDAASQDGLGLSERRWRSNALSV